MLKFFEKSEKCRKHSNKRNYFELSEEMMKTRMSLMIMSFRCWIHKKRIILVVQLQCKQSKPGTMWKDLQLSFLMHGWIILIAGVSHFVLWCIKFVFICENIKIIHDFVIFVLQKVLPTHNKDQPMFYYA